MRRRRVWRIHSTRITGSSATIERYASSSRRRGVTASTAMPACTSAATTSERRMPSRSTSEPSLRAANLRDAGQLAGSTAAARTASSTSRSTVCPAPMISSTAPAGDERAVVDDEDVAADLLDLGQQVARQQHGRAARRQLRDAEAHPAGLGGVHAVRRFVEDEQLGPVHHGLGDAEPLAHALGVPLHLAVDRGAEVGEVERVVEPRRRPRVVARGPVQLQVAEARTGTARTRVSRRATRRGVAPMRSAARARPGVERRRRRVGSTRPTCAPSSSCRRRSVRAGRTLGRAPTIEGRGPALRPPHRTASTAR